MSLDKETRNILKESIISGMKLLCEHVQYIEDPYGGVPLACLQEDEDAFSLFGMIMADVNRLKGPN